MDDGYVIPGLDEKWSFAGATLPEWISGVAAAMVASEMVSSASRSMPILIMALIATPLILAAIRKQFPDEERGLRNALTVAMGMKPMGIPLPSKLQPVWSGSPLRRMDEKKEFRQLNLDVLFVAEE